MQFKFGPKDDVLQAGRERGYIPARLIGCGQECDVVLAFHCDTPVALKVWQPKFSPWDSEWGTRPFDNPIIDFWKCGKFVGYVQALTETAYWSDACRLAEQIARAGWHVRDWSESQCGKLPSGAIVLNDYYSAWRYAKPENRKPEEHPIYCNILVRY